jgi:hypothetical protein
MGDSRSDDAVVMVVRLENARFERSEEGWVRVHGVRAGLFSVSKSAGEQTSTFLHLVTTKDMLKGRSERSD